MAISSLSGVTCLKPVCDMMTIRNKVNELVNHANNTNVDSVMEVIQGELTRIEEAHAADITRLEGLIDGIEVPDAPESTEPEFLPHVVTIGNVEIVPDDIPYSLIYDPNDYEIIYGYIGGRLCVSRLRGNVGSTQSLEFTTAKYVNGTFTLIFMRLTLGADSRTLTKSVCATASIDAQGVVTVNKSATGILIGRFYGIPKNETAASRGEEYDDILSEIVGGGPRT